jgi:replicative DNA helicase Mcm
VEGLLVRVSQPSPLVVNAVFRCNVCGTEQPPIPQKGLTLQRPRQCINEGCRAAKRTFTFVPEASEYVNIQLGRLQESPEELPPGQIPRFMDILLRGHLVEVARPGDPVLATGILRPHSASKFQPSALFQYQLEINYIEPLSKEPSAISITKEEEEEFKRFAKGGDAFEKLTASFAPSIYGMTDVKKSLLLSLLGGQERTLPDKIKIRGDIHILLIGDPGTAKSELLKYVAQVAPKGLFTSGRGTTAVGLTAAVVKDAGGSFSLEAGAVVLADKGLCSIDEIDKMKPEDRVALHEALEQQTVSIAKGGIVATLNARTTVVAAANPKEGRYNPIRMVSENINLPITLLSRFDLIHIVKDEPSRDTDKALVEHVLDIRTREDAFKGLLPVEFVRKYIVYAKRLKPALSDEAKEIIRDFYLKMREMGSPESPISISPRQVESLMRLADARARADLSEVVTAKHAEDAIRLVSGFLRQVGMDTESGAIDVDIILTGVPQRRRSKTGVILSELESLQREQKGPVAREDLINRVMERSKLEASEIESLISALITQGAIYEPRPGLLSTTL